MSRSNGTEVLIVLNAAPDLEEPVIDWLLSRDDSAGFTSSTVFGHSTDHDNLSQAEQVTGRQRRLQFQIQVAGERADSFLDDARHQFGAAGIRFWMIPLIAAGHLGRSPID